RPLLVACACAGPAPGQAGGAPGADPARAQDKAEGPGKAAPPQSKTTEVTLSQEEVSQMKILAPPSPAKSKLEEMLEQALKANPDLRVAAAKVQEAEAELNRTRLEVTRKVVTLYTGLEAARKTVEVAEKRLGH